MDKKIGKIKRFLIKHFPRLLKVSEELNEVGMSQHLDSMKDELIATQYIDWVVHIDYSTLIVKVQHTYSRKGKELFFELEEASVPYMFAHAEPEVIRPDGSTAIQVKKLVGMPVFRFKNSMYDVSKISFFDFASMLISKGKILEKAKTKTDILKYYAAWIDKLSEASEEIMVNAMS